MGDVQVITSGKKKDAAILTTIRVFKATISERLMGIVSDWDSENGFGFISNQRGSI